ncbi:UNVERIFIED_CONTAM: hypothetical protein NCL1_33730 [Trichonephila clavipes]
MWPLEDAGWTVPDFSVMLVAVNLRPQQIQRTDLLSQCLIRRYQPSDVRPTLAWPYFSEDKAKPHTARVAINCLTACQTLPWLARSPYLFSIEHVWYMM